MFDDIPVPLRVIQQRVKVLSDLVEYIFLKFNWPVFAVQVLLINAVGDFILHVQGRHKQP
jgi:hypothetical protein